MKRLVDTIDQQSTLIGALKDEVQQQREVSMPWHSRANTPVECARTQRK